MLRIQVLFVAPSISLRYVTRSLYIVLVFQRYPTDSCNYTATDWINKKCRVQTLVRFRHNYIVIALGFEPRTLH